MEKQRYFNRVYVLLPKNSINIMKYGSQVAKGITLNNETLNSIPVLLPSKEEQEEIVDILRNTDKKIDLIQNQIFQMENFKKGLLQQMFNESKIKVLQECFKLN